MTKKKKRNLLIVGGILVALFLLFLCIPVPRFEVPYASVVMSEDGQFLGAKVADDGQWRFPPSNHYSEKYVRCLLEFEDREFFLHPGIDPLALGKAFVTNLKAGEVKRGGSTITMQVARLSRGNRPRTYKEKIIEMILSLRLELRYSKREILDLYAANAPFGGNVVGVDAAAWRYFNTTPDQLTLAEAATLAVLPNAPSLVHLSRNRSQLKEKRDALIQKMSDQEAYLPRRYRKLFITKDDCELAVLEQIPSKTFEMPNSFYHFVMETIKSHKGKSVHTSIDYQLQQYVVQILNRHYEINSANNIENSAVYILDYRTNEVVAYVGNNNQAKDAAMVDMVKAQRSTGSILKPFLFAAMLDEGLLLPNMVLPDVPVNIAGYTPKNYSGDYWGAVTAHDALTNSLNTPFVYLLRKYSFQKFYSLLRKMKFSGINREADFYGLSIILGGAETSLFDIVNAYGNMARKLAFSNDTLSATKAPFSADAVGLTFNVMQDLNRPYEQLNWRFFNSSQRIAWKTGTSFGFRDAWAVGVTDRYVVGVWCGNANGEGRPGLTGINVAAPIMFEVFSKIRDSYTYPEATEHAVEVEVCAESGYPKSMYCPKVVKQLMPDVEIKTGVCPYHKKVFLDKTGQYQVYPSCYDVDKDKYEIYYVLPPVMEWFYKRHTPLYRPLPPTLQGCRNANDDEVMSFIYPESSVSFSIPIGIKGDRQKIIFEIAHRNAQKTVFWTLDDVCLGETKMRHQMAIDVEKGVHNLRCVDEDGNELNRKLIVK